MRSADSAEDFARLQTPYINTTGLCLELYFQARSTSSESKPVISVVAVNEEEEETVLVSTEGLERTVWDRLFTKLPGGVHRVVVQGQRSEDSYSSMSVDDVVVQPCENFGDSISSFITHCPIKRPAKLLSFLFNSMSHLCDYY